MNTPKQTTGITLKEIARQLGLTPRAVSQALRDDRSGTTRIAAKTVARVRALAEEGGYRLNTSARALRTQSFRQAGVLIRYNFGKLSLAMPEMPAIFGLGDFLNTRGWHLVIVQDNAQDLKKDVPHYIREHTLDGLVVASLGPQVDEQRASVLAGFGIPYIWFNNNSPVNAVGIQDAIGGELATQHLLDLGHRRIVFLGGASNHSSFIDREKGYQKAMTASGLEPITWGYKANVSPGRTEAAERQLIYDAQLQEIVKDLMPRHKPTGLVCYTDFEALMATRALLTAGFKVPGDVSVVGYNDLPLVETVYPALTSIRPDFYLLGKMAGEMLMEHLQSPDEKLASRFICPELVVRDSSGPVASVNAF